MARFDELYNYSDGWYNDCKRVSSLMSVSLVGLNEMYLSIIM